MLILILFQFVNFNGQDSICNLLGVRIGFIKNSYYDESMSFNVFNGIRFNPFQIRYLRNTDKNTYIANILYANNTLSPTVEEDYVISDELVLIYGELDFTWLRQWFEVSPRLNIRLGARLSTNGYNCERTLKKTISAMKGTQLTYEVTIVSFQPCGQITYSFPKNANIGFKASFPLMALNLNNYNSRISPSDQELWLVSLNKYAGFSTEFDFMKKSKRFSFELFHYFQFIKYKEPSLKKVLNSQVGIGLYYDL